MAIFKKKHRLDDEIERVTLVLEKTAPDTNEYKGLTEQLKMLKELKQMDDKNKNLQIHLDVNHLISLGGFMFAYMVLIKFDQNPNSVLSKHIGRVVDKLFRL